MKNINDLPLPINYKPIIGLEVHVELKTKSKMFCSCSADYFGKKPNTHTCPVCLGLPGALPVPNKTAIEWCVMLGMSLNCKIHKISKFDRKNYFYPDLPKGYQISQYDEPFCINGNIKLSSGKTIRIRRVHMEEDTGKLIHQDINGKKVTLIDFNRSGVPLVEVVTEPDFENSADVKEYLQKLQQIVRYLDISNADMERGDMRFEPNISLHEVSNNKLPAYKVEVKNINSFRFVERAINFETNRQLELLKKGQTPIQETRGWDEKRKETVTQRVKEEASDYRYFPEPDIPSVRWSILELDEIKIKMPELPDKRLERFIKEYKLTEYNAEIITREKSIADYFEKIIKINKQLKNKKEKSIDIKTIANFIINKKIDINNILPAELIKTIISAKQTVSIPEDKIKIVINQVLQNNQQAANEYKKGKTQTLEFLIGQVIKQIKGADVNTIRNILKKLLEEK